MTYALLVPLLNCVPLFCTPVHYRCCLLLLFPRPRPRPSPRPRLPPPPPPLSSSSFQLASEKKKAEALRKIKGEEEKNKGNEQLKAGKYQAAIQCYTRGMAADPESAILPANRALANLKMKRSGKKKKKRTK